MMRLRSTFSGSRAEHRMTADKVGGDKSSYAPTPGPVLDLPKRRIASPVGSMPTETLYYYTLDMS